MESTDPGHIPRRLAAQQISRHDFSKPADLVRALGAVQAQDLPGARWALGLRLAGDATAAGIDRALADGAILRTHAMRWTWQLVHAADIRWLVALFAPRLFARQKSRHRELELDPAIFRRSRATLEKALRDGQHLTREELAAALERARIRTSEQRLSHLLGYAELEGLLCSGAPRGRLQTFALLDQRVPAMRAMPGREASIAELALRYFRTRGPATLADFGWWSGLNLGEIRPALEAIAPELVEERIAGQTCFRANEPPPKSPAPAALLLPAFDEYLVAYRDRGAALAEADVKRVNEGGGMLRPCVVVRGKVAGTWRRELAPGRVFIEIASFREVAPAAERAMRAAARRYAEFLGLEAIVTIEASQRKRASR